MFSSSRQIAASPLKLGAATDRRADISWLRILAVLLLFPFHTARVFNIGEEFYVKNDQLSFGLTYFIDFVSRWHMPLLFLLAGAASWFALGRRSGRHYLGERFKRLFLPFLFGVLVLIPPQSYLGLVSHGAEAPGFFAWLPNFFQINGADMDGYFLGGHTWGHLWFIAHLFFYALLALPVMLLLRRGLGDRVRDLLASAVRIPGVILLFGLCLIPAMFVPDIAGGNPIFYIVMFLLGYVIVSDVRFEQAIDRHRRVALVLGPAVCLVAAYFDATAWPAIPGWAQLPLQVYLGVMVPWFCMVALLGYGRRVLGRSNRFVRYADEASYPVYLLHQTVIVALAFLVVRWDVALPVKFTAILTGSVIATVLAYELIVRRVAAVRFLFGMKPLRVGSGAAVAQKTAESPASTAARPVDRSQGDAQPERQQLSARAVTTPGGAR